MEGLADREAWCSARTGKFRDDVGFPFDANMYKIEMKAIKLFTKSNSLLRLGFSNPNI